jgi:hypothetical protein
LTTPWNRSTSSTLLGTKYLPTVSSLSELAISLSLDFLVATGGLVGGSHIANRAVESYFIVVLDVAFDEANAIVHS